MLILTGENSLSNKWWCNSYQKIRLTDNNFTLYILLYILYYIIRTYIVRYYLLTLLLLKYYLSAKAMIFIAHSWIVFKEITVKNK